MDTTRPTLREDPTNDADTNINIVSLDSQQASKITHISLYAGRAEITRLFKLSLLAGQNQVTIRGLPFQLQQDSIRVDGRGNASIRDVVISKTPREYRSSESHTAALKTLERKRQELKNQITNIKQSRAHLDTYLASVEAGVVNIASLEDIFKNYNTIGRKLDNYILDLEQELDEVKREQSLLRNDTSAEEVLACLPWQVAIKIWDAKDEEVKIVLKYVVTNADWAASYDIRVDSQSVDKTVAIVYKASITQNTGESWDAVPLTLETVTPTLGMTAPALSPWNIFDLGPLSAPQAMMMGMPMTGMSMPRMPMTEMPGMASPPAVVYSRSSSRSRSRSRSPRHRRRSTSPQPYVPPVMQHQFVSVTNKGNISATFRVPGHITIPTDAEKHNVTIATFHFNVPLTWYTVPKQDARVYMEAKIKNDSEYTFIRGPANVYVDGSFIATTSVPPVSPQESFSCAFGLDPSLRVTYDRKDVNTNVTGFYKKSTTKTITRRITIQNTKTIPVMNLKVIDNIPVSKDERIHVNLLQPALRAPAAEPPLQRGKSIIPGEKTNASKEKTSRSVQVAPGVAAQWEGADDPDVNQDLVGKDGRVQWSVTLRPQETVNLVLKCEVTFPENMRVANV